MFAIRCFIYKKIKWTVLLYYIIIIECWKVIKIIRNETTVLSLMDKVEQSSIQIVAMMIVVFFKPITIHAASVMRCQLRKFSLLLVYLHVLLRNWKFIRCYDERCQLHLRFIFWREKISILKKKQKIRKTITFYFIYIQIKFLLFNE